MDFEAARGSQPCGAMARTASAKHLCNSLHQLQQQTKFKLKKLDKNEKILLDNFINYDIIVRQTKFRGIPEWPKGADCKSVS